jgi:cytochrome c oxidase subunit 2
MAEGNGPGRITSSGLAFAGLIALLIIFSLWLFIAQPWWFPTLASVHGAEIDAVFMAVLIVSGVAFVVTQGLLGYFVARYGSTGNEKAGYWHDNPKAEFFLLTGTAVILVILVFMGQQVWWKFFFGDKPADAMQVHVLGQQFQWNFHYPGADGKFGATKASLMSTQSPRTTIGLDETDPAAKDDVVTIGELHLISNKPVTVHLRSKDVIHSFFLPNQRIKQDAVPGLAIQITFTPTTPGKYEIACAELCGALHYNMKGALTVEANEQDFVAWQRSLLAPAQ